MNKAPDAFRTISEVAEELDLPQHVLRFWESRFSHIKPLKRGGGRRYYRPEDVDLLRGIRRLLYSDGYTIKGVQRILREQGVRTVQLVGQGQALNPGLPPQDDGPDGDDGNSGDVATVNSLMLPPSHPLDEAEDESRRRQALAVVQSAPPPKNGPIAEAGIAGVAQATKIEAVRKLAPHAAAPVAAVSAAAGPGAAVAIAIGPAAASSPPHLVAKAPATLDLDRLKRALAELEACRRLLDKAIDGER